MRDESCGCATKPGRPVTYCTGRLTRMGVACEVIAPTLIPVKPGEDGPAGCREAGALLSGRRSDSGVG